MGASLCKIPVGEKGGKKHVAIIDDQGGAWTKIVDHARQKGPFMSPEQLRQAFPGVRFTVQAVS
jgi:hypothetical protein